MNNYKYVSKNIPRIEGRTLALGAPVYIEDKIPKDCLRLEVVRCPYASAEVLSIDTRIAEKVPGVVKIFTWEDTTVQCTTGFSYSPYEHTLLKKHARYAGDAVAMIVADKESTAVKAKQLLKIKWRVKEPLTNLEQALENPIVVHADQLDKIVRHGAEDRTSAEGYVPEKNQIKAMIRDYGNVAKAFEESDFIVTSKCTTKQQMHSMMETHRSLSYIDESGHLVIAGPMQAVYPIQDSTAVMLNIDRRRIRVIKTQVGGAFGGKDVFFPYMAPAYAAWQLKKPVLYVMSRAESMTCTGTRHEYALTVRMGATKEGIIKAVSSEGFMNGGAYAELSDEVLETGIRNVYPIFPRVDALRIHQVSVHTNKVMGCAFRGFGATQNTFALNCAARRMAEALKMDYAEFLLKNVVRTGDSHPIMNGYLEDDPAIVQSAAVDTCILRAKEMIEWDKKRNLRLPEGKLVRGVGIGIASHASGVPRVDRAGICMMFNADGSFSVFSGHSDIGTGSNTAILQIIAETLDVPMDMIHLKAADSAFTPFDNGTYASSNVYRVGNAAKRAAFKMKQKLAERAVKTYQLSTDETVVFKAQAFYKGSGEKLDDLVGFADKQNSYWEGADPIVVSASFPDDFAPSPYAASCAEVEVDKETGACQILNFVSAIDSGQIINPINARVQALGGIVQSIGMTMFEEVLYTADGSPITKDFQSYKIPCEMDIPEIRVDFVRDFEPSGPFGAKSLGEICTGSVAPAICDAIFNATGVHIDSLPVTPERLFKAMNAGWKGGRSR